jgi:hypothetical protein
VFAVIPARNEAARILSALRTVRQAGVHHIVVVINGCEDDTREVVSAQQDGHLSLLTFREPLGVDIPRAIGAAYAYAKGARHVLFYDGDLIGHHRDELARLVESAQRFDLDLALTDSYGTAHGLDTSRDLLLKLRRDLNRRLGLEARLGLANPAHGPHAVSRRLLRDIPVTDLAQPPLVLLHAARNDLRIDNLAHIPHARLGSAHKGPEHFELIRETIIGDLVEALQVMSGAPRTRIMRGSHFDGYHSERRFDLLTRFLEGLKAGR